MNLYRLHAKPKELDHHDKAHEDVPELYWPTDDPDHRDFDPKKKLKPETIAKKFDKIAADPDLAFKYAIKIRKGRFPEGEAAMATDPDVAFSYANSVLRGPFKKAEDTIAKNGEVAYMYARYALKKRFPKGEEAISKRPFRAKDYASYVLYDRFPLGEPYILEEPNDHLFSSYMRTFMHKFKERWIEAEPRLKRIGGHVLREYEEKFGVKL